MVPGSVVAGDAGLLDSLLLNLLSNAIKFTEDGGTVRVSGAVAGGRFFLQVSDTGIGMSSDDLGQLFRPFFRSTDATARRIGGSGLGLTIVKRIVDQHHGEIRVVSERGIGTTVEVTLPLALHGPVHREADQALPRVTIFSR
jgi:signal transduction histidine kinase